MHHDKLPVSTPWPAFESQAESWNQKKGEAVGESYFSWMKLQLLENL